MLTQMDGIRAGRCLDGHSTGIEPGGEVRVFPCIKRWPQFVSFGNGTFAPAGSMHFNVPKHIVDRIRQSQQTNGDDDDEQEAHLCIGVLGRGDKDEDHLYGIEEEGEVEEQPEENIHTEEDGKDEELAEDGRRKLKKWKGEKLVATRCSNTGAIIEWLFIPYIVEDEHADNATVVEENQSSEALGSSAPTCASSSGGVCSNDESPSLDKDKQELPSNDGPDTATGTV